MLRVTACDTSKGWSSWSSTVLYTVGMVLFPFFCAALYGLHPASDKNATQFTLNMVYLGDVQILLDLVFSSDAVF